MNEAKLKRLNREGADLRRKLNTGLITEDELERLKQIQHEILNITHNFHA